MIYVEILQDGTSVGFIHYRPFDEKYGLGKTQAELETTGILVDSIPEPEVVEGKAPVLKYNPDAKELYYEYVDRPLTPEEQIKQLQEAIAELTILLASSTN